MWQQPCREATERLGTQAVRQALQAAGAGRFEVKVARITAATAQVGPEQALWQALLDCLGVGGDRDGFRRLAEKFPATLARSVPGSQLEAALVHVAGLGPAPDLPNELRLPEPISPAIGITGRPANRPQGRLAGLASLHRKAGIGLSQMALESVAHVDKAADLLAVWQAAGREKPALIGPARAQELLVNAVLPFAASQGLSEKARWLLERLTAVPAYGRTAFLETNLRPQRGRIARNVLQQQGLLGFIETWCSQGGCGRCPLS